MAEISQFHSGFLYILVFQLIVIGFQSVSVKRKEYFYYICYILFVIVYNLRIIFPDWFQKNPDFLFELSDKPVIALMLWSYFQFIRYFLDIPKLKSLDHKINLVGHYLFFFFITEFVLAFFPSVAHWNQVYFNIQSVICVSLFVIFFGSFLLQRKARLNNFMIPAVIIVLLGCTVSFLMFELNKRLNWNLEIEYLVLPHQIMTILELALFTAGVSMKAYIIEKEKRATENLLWAKENESHQLTKEILELKTAFASELHDDIGASLSSIDIYANVGLNGIQNQNSQLAENSLHSINHVVHQSLTNMRDTLWLLDKSPNTLGNCYSRWLDFTAPLLSASKIDFQNHWKDELNDIPISIKTKRDIFLTLKEAVNNIIRHAQTEKVRLQAWKENDFFFIELIDEGKGFDLEHCIMNGNGILHMSQRLTEDGGNVKVISQAGEGTTVRIEMKYD